MAVRLRPYRIRTLPWTEGIEDICAAAGGDATRLKRPRRRAAARQVACELMPAELTWICYDPPWADREDPRPSHIYWVLPHPIIEFDE